MDYKLYYNINEIQDLEQDKEVTKKELYTLWQDCFGDSQSYTDFYFKWKVNENQILSIYKQDKISSMLHLNPYILMVQGSRIPVNYIVGVATKQEDRRQGLMRILLEASLHDMYQEHMPFTYLMPAAEAIYLPFGFRIVYEQEPWNQLLSEDRQKLTQMDISHKSVSDSLNIVTLETRDREKLEDLVAFSNQQLSQKYDVYTERTQYYYKRLVYEMKSTGGEVLLCYRKEKLVGYASYMAEGDIYITECIYCLGEKEAVMDGISKFTEKAINWDSRIDKKEDHNIPTIMARIVDWKSFVQNISASEEINIIMEVKDPIIEDNNGVYSLQFTKQGCEVTRTKKEPEVSADIADLSRLFFGRIERADLLKIVYGGDKINIRSKLEKIYSYKKVFINEVV